MGKRSWGRASEGQRACRIEHLEERTLLSIEPTALYAPPRHDLARPGGYLTLPSPGAPLEIALSYLESQASALGIAADSVRSALVTDAYSDSDTGVTHIYLRETWRGVEIVNANLNVNVTADGRVLSVGCNFVDLAGGDEVLPGMTPPVSAGAAIGGAATELGLSASQPTQGIAWVGPVSDNLRFTNSQLSLDLIPARLRYVATQTGLQAVWNTVLRTPDGEHWYDVNVDATDGQVLGTTDWVEHASYNVYQRPTETPVEGNRTIVTDPQDLTASPYGWHDTNGVAGAEYTDTRGNNVSAQEDVDGNNTGGARPDGGASLTFDFPVDLTQAPSAYQSAATTNLFYWNNLLHDVHYKYGFNEVAGNFQVTNYSGQGLGNDAVQADAQDGSGMNNANFGTPPDGTAPRMQMFLWSTTSPYRDGDFDNQIIVHEYGHGVSNRLVGGPANSSALSALQSGGMGEGWGDWWGLMFTMKPTDTKAGSYPMGTYVEGQPPTGGGIRHHPYSFDMSVNPFTYGVYNSHNEVHYAGEIWCSALWDMTWLLIDKYGFNPDISGGYTGAGSAGNILALQLVMDSLKLMPALPSFLDSRDAILQADQLLTGGANFSAIWTAFARRGMGYSAYDGGSADALTVTEAFDMPSVLIDGQTPSGVSFTPVSSLSLHFSSDMDQTSFSLANDVVSFTGPGGVDLRSQISGFTWTDASTLRIDFPSTTVDGQYTLVIGPQILRSSDLMPLDQDQDGIVGEAVDDRYTAAFRYDSTLLQVTAVTPVSGSLVNLPMTELTVHFNESVAAASLGTDDLQLNQGSVAGFTLVDASTVRYSLSGVVHEPTLSVTMPAGSVTDLGGNPMAAYSASYSLDGSLMTFTTGWTQIAPAGSLAYRCLAPAAMSYANDSDTFTLALNAGTALALSVSPAANLQPVLELRDPAGSLLGSATAAQVGNEALLQTFIAASTGTYTITVHDAQSAVGGYTLYAYCSAALETESHGGPRNDTAGAAQDLDSVFTTLTVSAQHAAVLGTTESGTADDYRFSAAVGQSISAAIRFASTADGVLELYDSLGNRLALGQVGAEQTLIDNYVVAAAGVLTLRVSGSVSDYNLLVTRGADIDREANNTPATAQPLYPAAAGVGNLNGLPAVDWGDYYQVQVNAGDALIFTTRTPGDQANEFGNRLDPKLELYDPAGNLLAADDNGSIDGRNAHLTYTAVSSGSYTVRVLAAAQSGEYVLEVAGASGGRPAFTASAATEPALGSRLRTAPTWTVHFSDSILLSTLNPGDFTVDGVAATAVTVVDDHSATFTLPAGVPDGLRTLAIAAGAVEDLQHTPVAAWSGQFTYDTTPPRVVSSSVQSGQTLASSNLTLTMQFNEALRVANLEAGDLRLWGLNYNWYYTPSSLSYDVAGTTLTIGYSGLPDDAYQFTLYSGDGRFEDLVGIDLDGETPTWPIPGNLSGNGMEGGNFVVEFALDALGSDHAPIAVDDVYNLSAYGTLTTPAPGVLANDTDADGNTLSAALVDAPLHGTLTLNADGSFVYTPTAGFSGADQFTYRASDGSVSSFQAATVRLRVAYPRLLSDIQTATADANPTNFVAINDTLFFTATSAMFGTELWKSDGSANGTQLVKDIYPGTSSGSLSSLVNFNGVLYFAASDGTNGMELWKSDGTAAGTVMVADIYSSGSSSSPAYLTVVGNTLYFAATTYAAGVELWKSDGTTAGTVQVADIYSGMTGSSPQNLTAVGATLFFTASDATNGRELWKSDGTAAGTVLVKDLTAGSGSTTLTNYAAAGGNFFFAFADTNGTELWKSDGTTAGTVMVKDIYAGSSNSSPSYLTAVGSTLYFRATTSSGAELWKSDGSSAGTTLVKDIYSGSGSSNPLNLVNVNGTLFFQAYDATNGYELWKSDGSSAGTTLVKDIYSGSGSSYPAQLAKVGNLLYFYTTTATTGYELWKSDGTAAGTVLVKDIYAGASNSSVLYITDVGGTAFFRATDGVHGNELWKSDGTAAHTVLIKDIRTGTADSSPGNFVDLGGTALFSVTNSTIGTELWKSDGTAAGTALVKDIYSGTNSSSPGSMVNVGGLVYFAATDSANGRELWKTNGTALGTVTVKNIASGSTSSSPSNLVNVGGTLFFTANDGVNGTELWKSDGTDAGTVLVKDITAGGGSTSFSNLTAVGNTVYFQASDATNGAELWKSDGTDAGTVLVKDIYPGASGSYPAYLVNLGGVLFFEANDGVNGYELWKSDGTDAGTALVKDIYSGINSSSPLYLTNVNGTLFFSAYDGTYYRELWKSDGTDAGTVLVKDIYSGTSSSSSPANLININGTLYFTATDGTAGTELWKSNGTSSGTTRVKDINSGTGNSSPSRLTNVNGMLYFTATDGASGVELWKTDGTTAGTVEIDIGFDAAASDPQNLTAIGTKLFLSVADPVVGREVWVVPDMPQVVSIVPADPSPTAAATVSFTVTFSQAVTGVDVADFSVSALGLPSAAVTAVSGSGTQYTVSVATGLGQGKLWLNLVDNDSILSAEGDPLGGPLAGNGNASSSPSYDVDRAPPVARILDVPTLGPAAPVEKLVILFSESVSGFDASDLRLTRDGGPNLLTGGESLVNTAGTTWSLGGLSGLTTTPGRYTLTLVAAGSGITDTQGTAIAAGASMSWILLSHTPPAAFDDVYSTALNSPLTVTAGAGLLANDTGAADVTLSATQLTAPLHGTLTLQASGGFTYQPAAGFMGTDLFTYATVDGTAQAGATVRITVGPEQLVTDINATAADASPSGFVELNSVVYYAATDALHGTELWRSDGTLAGTYLVKDIYPGAISASISYLTVFNGALYFAANDGVSGTELWRSDGTAAGTQLFAEIYAGSSSSSPAYLTVLGDNLFFRAANSAAGTELWTSDGTAAGTTLVKDIYSGASSSYPAYLTNVNGTLFFQATDATSGYELWKSDGTAAGTTLVADIYSGTSSSSPTNLTNVNGTLFFTAIDATNGNELWKSDGTAAGTTLVKDIYSGSSSSSTGYLTNVNGTLFFRATDSTNGSELWKSDGTAAGTVMVKDICTGFSSANPYYLTNLGGTLFFQATDGVNGYELWKSDGTAAGTVMLKDIYAGFSSSLPAYLTNVSGTLFFQATDGVNGYELWKSDGTAAGTTLVKDLATGTGSSTPGTLASVAGLLYFVATDGVHGREAWRSDGTATGTVMLGDARPGTADASPTNPLAVGNTLYFAGTNSAAGSELWKSDLSGDGTKLVKDCNSGSSGSVPANFYNVNGTFFFTASDSTIGRELWKSDGTAAGTMLVKDITSGSGSTYFDSNSMAAIGNVFYFEANDNVSGWELWKSDGTAAGTVMVKDIYSGSSSGYPYYLTNLGGTLYFRAYDGVNGYELWKSDGTAAGTVMLKDIYSGSSSSTPAYLTNVGGTLYFQATDGTNGYELWKSDGTAAGTVLVKDISSGASSSSPANFTSVNGTLYFTATDGLYGTELWKSDGTDAGTTLVADINAGATSSSPTSLTNLNGTLYFAADDGLHGAELWKSDGTAAGTVLVKDLASGSAGSGIKYLTAVKNTLAFTANDGLIGNELWTSDGTAAGTMPIDLAPGADGAEPTSLVAVGGWLSFAANNGYYGRELWSLPLGVSPTDISLTSATVTENAAVGTTIGTLATVDADPTHTSFTYSLASGAGGADNGLFAISGNALTVRVPLDFETHPQYYVRVHSVNTEGLFYDKAFVINVTNANEAPAAVDDDYTVSAGSLTVSAPGVLSNDADPEGGALSAILVDNPLHGAVTLQANGAFTYTPTAGYTGDDFFTYRVSDGSLQATAPTVVYLRVTPPVLAGDINTLGADSNPANFTSVGSVVFFTATDIAHGTELWKTDGTAAGTLLVKDIYAGVSSSAPANLVSYNGALYFTANNGTSGTELWKSDGTTAGTAMVIDLYSGVSNGSPSSLTVMNGLLYFAGASSSSGTELWKSDGSVAGTTLVADIVSGTSSSSPQNLFNLNGTLFFSASTSTNGRELWKSDGTAAGTLLVKDICAGVSSSVPANLTNVNGTLFFTATDGSTGVELWKSDGTAAGTTLVKDIYSSIPPSSSSPANLTNVNGTLFFTATDGSTGIELWKSDGTDAGTVLVKDIYSGASSSSPAYLVNLNGTLLFTASTGSTYLWKSDGTTAGTVQITTSLYPMYPSYLTVVNGAVCFQGYDSTNYTELWRTDGTAEGTTMLKDIRPGAWSSSPSLLANVGGALYFAANDGLFGKELWTSDGTTAGTRLLADIRKGTADATPGGLKAVDGAVYFRALKSTSAYALFKADGTAGGITEVSAVYPSGGTAANMAVVNGLLFYDGYASATGAELYKTDGTPAGTVLVKDIYSGTSGSSLTNLTNVNGTLFFAANDGTSGTELWKSDGTPAGTVLVKDIYSGTSGSSLANLTNVNGTLFFAANDGTSGTELWKSDGTPAGTVLVKDIYAGTIGSSLANLTNVNGTLFFTATDGTSGTELWKSDGTAAGTVMVLDIYTGAPSAAPAYLTNVNGTLYFSANNGSTLNGTELWKSDGSAAGTAMVKDIYSGTGSSSPLYLTNVNGTLFFQAYTTTSGYELWKSDGTSGGTALVKDIATVGSSSPVSLVNINGTLYFNASDGVTGNELWKSDGTAAGTVLAADIMPGLPSGNPQALTAVLGGLAFIASDGLVGSELWVVPNLLAPQATSIVRADANPTRADTVRFTVTFNQPVTGVDAGDFTLAASGVTGAAIASVGGSGVTYTVTVNTGAGSGTLRLDLADNDSILAFGTPLGGAGSGNGARSGDQAYSFFRSAPAVNAGLSTVTVNEGQTAQNAGAFSDPDGETVTLSASFGSLSQTGSSSGSWTWSADNLDGPRDSRTVTITAIDSGGMTNTVNFALAVVNLAPSASIAGPATGSVGAAVTLTGTAADTPTGDQAAGLTLSWTVIKRTDAGQTIVATGAAANLTFTPDAPALYEARFTATDRDGATSLTAVHLLTVGGAVPKVIAPDVSAPVLDVVLQTAAASPQPQVTVTAADPAGLANIVALLPTVSDPGRPVTVGVSLTNNTTYAGMTITVPHNITLVLDGQGGTVVIQGHSPALIVSSGDVIVQNGVTLVTATDDPTVLVTGGSLTIRGSTITETVGGDQAAIEIRGGTVDLGTAAGGNTFNVQGAGQLIKNTGASAVAALGNTWQQDGLALSTNAAVEARVTHQADNAAYGRVTWQTLTSIAVAPATVNLLTGQTQQFTAVGYDQFGEALSTPPTFAWNATSGSISTGGFYTAPLSAAAVIVSATSGGASGSASVTVATPPHILAWYSVQNHKNNVGDVGLLIADDDKFSEPRSGGILRLSINFDKPIAPASFTAAAVKIAGNRSSGAVDLSSLVITPTLTNGNLTGVITFNSALPNLARYLIRLQGVTDTAGNPLAGDVDRVLASLKGDANGDLHNNVTDLSYIQSVATTAVSAANVKQVRADINMDGKVNVTDLSVSWGQRNSDVRSISIPVLSGGNLMAGLSAGFAATAAATLSSAATNSTTAPAAAPPASLLMPQAVDQIDLAALGASALEIDTAAWNGLVSDPLRAA